MNKKSNKKKIIVLLFALVTAMSLIFASGCGGKSTDNNTTVKTTTAAASETVTSDSDTGTETYTTVNPDDEASSQIKEDQEYSSLEQVSAYIHLYKHLPSNYITKSEAKKAGWVSSEGNLWDVAPGKSIGGDVFKNREKQLPVKSGRTYYECDVNYEGGYRGDDRIIYSDDGLVYYTGDHYNSFMLLFGDPDA